MLTLVQGIFQRRTRQGQAAGFDKIQGFVMWTMANEIKVRKHIIFMGLARTFRAWAQVTRAEVQ
jgi:hypothetical protein